MITIKSLLKDLKEKTDKANELRIAIVKEKEQTEQNEAELWITTPFKEKGLTNDKMRNAYVKQQMGLLYPSFYASKKAELAGIEAEIKWIYEMISTMKLFGVFEIELEETEEKPKPEKEEDSE